MRKKIYAIEIIVVLLVIAALCVYLAPNIIKSKDDKIISQIKASNAIFTSKIIEEFASNENILPSQAADKVISILNKSEKNPFDNKKDLYMISKDTSGISNVECDDNLKMVIVTTLDKKGTLIARTVIKPPSYVAYYKEQK